tara:strand:+ start:4869 stop:6563 length:1695 start_codon:yes stop_codon:yes gene_type:complete
MAEDTYMSGRYGADSDGGVAYTEKTLDTSRKRIEKKQKYFERFNKLYPLIKGGIALGNAVVGDKAQARENELNFQFANHKIVHNNGKTVRLQHETNQQNKVSDLEYLTSIYETQIKNGLLDEYGDNIDLNSMAGVINKYATEYGNNDLVSYQKMVKEAYDLPEWDEEGVAHQEWYNKTQGGNPPKNIMQLVTNKVREFVKGNDKETLDAEIQLSPVEKQFQEYGEFEEAAKTFHDITGKGMDLSKVYAEVEKENLIKGKVGERKIIISPETYDPETDTYSQQQQLLIVREGVRGANETWELVDIGDPIVKPRDQFLNPSDIAGLLEKVMPNTPSFDVVNQYIKDKKGSVNIKDMANIMLLIDPMDRTDRFDDIDEILQTVLGSNLSVKRNGQIIMAGEFDNASNRWRINPKLTQEEREELGLATLETDMISYLQSIADNNYKTSRTGMVQTQLDSEGEEFEVPPNAIGIQEYFETNTNLDAGGVTDYTNKLVNMETGLLFQPTSSGGLGLLDLIEKNPNQDMFKFSNKPLDVLFNDESLSADPVDIIVRRTQTGMQVYFQQPQK